MNRTIALILLLIYSQSSFATDYGPVPVVGTGVSMNAIEYTACRDAQKLANHDAWENCPSGGGWHVTDKVYATTSTKDDQDIYTCTVHVKGNCYRYE